ncbi:Putative Trehalase [Rhizopus microsporus]|nr:Putative Trehalase [Rhizopus microsporus]
MDKLMWNDDHYSFYDFNLTSNAQNIEFTPANLYPIWLEAIPNHLRTNKTKLSHTLDAAEEALRKYPGILTTSYYNTTMQWDWPNGWPPLTFIAIQSFMNVDTLLDSKYTTRYGTSYSELAQVLAARYAASAFCGWYKTGGSVPGVLPKTASTSDEGHMFEKFDVTAVGTAGGQGEYTPQVGFGWTNGVAMWIFNTFDNLTAPADCNQNITINF